MGNEAVGADTGLYWLKSVVFVVKSKLIEMSHDSPNLAKVAEILDSWDTAAIEAGIQPEKIVGAGESIRR